MNKIIKIVLAVSVFMSFGFVAYSTHAAGSLTITSPNGGESYKAGDTITIQWTSQGVNGKVALFINRSDANNNFEWAMGTSAFAIDNTGSQVWTIPTDVQQGTRYKISIQSHDDASIVDYSDNYFTINANNNSGGSLSLSQLNPSSGAPGTIVTVTGAGFAGQNNVNYKCDNYGSGMVANVTNISINMVQFQIPTWLPAGNCNISIANTNGESNVLTFTVGSATTTHSVGTNVLGSDGTVYFIDTGNSRSPYTSAGAFLSYKFNTWASVVAANSADMALPLTTYTPNGSNQTTTYFIPPRNGSLINDHGTVYLITNGLRTGFASAFVFQTLGYSFNNVYPGDTSFMVTLAPINSSSMAHPDGTLINDSGTIYVMKNGNRMGFPSMAVFDSWGYWLNEAVPANSYDRQAPVSGVIDSRMSNQLSI